MTLTGAEEFLSQTGKTTIALAKLLLRYEKGERLPRMMDFARELKAGNGTIQEAFNYLIRPGAIVVEARGSQGSRLSEINYPLLWRYAGNELIVGSMPLPYTLRYEGLATGLYAQLEASSLPFNMTFQRGSLSRGEMVRKGSYHYAVMSLLAAEHFVSQYPDTVVIGQLPARTYVAEHVLISCVPREEIRRIGVDLSSLDEVLLTEVEFGRRRDCEIIPINRAQVLDLLQEGLFDAVIWNQDGIRAIPAEITVSPLQYGVREREAATKTAIVALKESPVRNLLLDIFSAEQITTIQREVCERQRLPRY